MKTVLKNLFLAGSLLLSSAASAAPADSARIVFGSYNRIDNKIELYVSYTGCGYESFRLEQDLACLESYPAQCSGELKMFNVGQCDLEISKAISLDHGYPRPAFVKINGAQRTSASIFVVDFFKDLPNP